MPAPMIPEHTTITQMEAQLEAAGWKRIEPRIWESPAGGLFTGPYGAWYFMTHGKLPDNWSEVQA